MEAKSVNIAKAMKVKNRLAGRLQKVQADIIRFNSVVKEQAGKVNVEQLLGLREELQHGLVSVKSSLAKATSAIQDLIILKGELKSAVAFYSQLPTQDGVVRSDYSESAIEYLATVQKSKADEIIRDLERQIDNIQDKLDEFNAVTKINIPEDVLKLVS